MKSLQGQLLIATPQLQDPNFVKTVVLMVRHDEDEALGLVLNRPLDVLLRDAMAQAGDEDYSGDEKLSQGGPCDGPLMVLHTHEVQAQTSIIKGVHFSAERDSIEWLLAHNRGPIRYFAGYAGWGAGQLEEELEVGGWFVFPAAAKHVFHIGGEDLWRQLNTQIALGVEVNPRIIPADPEAN